jgi:uncharacterized protein (DUF58 family)
MVGGRMGNVLRGVVLAASVLPLLGLCGCGSNTNPDFSLTVVEPSVTLEQGGTATVDFTVGAVHGSHGSIMLSLNGLPTGVGVAPATATVGIGSPQQFVLTAANSAPVTPTPVTIVATGLSGLISSTGLVTHTATFALTIAAPPPAP